MRAPADGAAAEAEADAAPGEPGELWMRGPSIMKVRWRVTCGDVRRGPCVPFLLFCFRPWGADVPTCVTRGT